MCEHDDPSNPRRASCGCSHPSAEAAGGMSRRGFLGGLGGLGGAAALGGLTVLAGAQARGAEPSPAPAEPLPPGKPLRVLPVLTYALPRPQEKTSWRSYGGLATPEDVAAEAKRIEAELKKLAAGADFPIQPLPVVLVDNQQKAEQAAKSDCDAILIFAAGGNGQAWFPPMAAARPCVMFVRHKSGPHYLWYEIAHWRFLRRNGDAIVETRMDVDDVVVDDYGEVLWRLRALGGLNNAKGTKMLAIGGLQAYSQPAQQLGPAHAKEVWGYQIEIVPYEDFTRRLAKARGDETVMKRAQQRTDALLKLPNVKLATERKFVVNSFLALGVCEDLAKETGATNFGFAHCMGRTVIEMLDTPPCLVLSLANDEGLTAYCHTDLSHTMPGVLLRWIAGRPTFVCNSHFPHQGIFTVAHCAAPRKMNGRQVEPATIMTHFESDYGAATKVEYTKGQVVTVIIPNLHLTKWQGFRGRVLDSPSNPACRSQIDIQVDGDWRRLLREMEGFHTQVCYGDWLREVGYALKKLEKIEWQSFSETA